MKIERKVLLGRSTTKERRNCS